MKRFLLGLMSGIIMMSIPVVLAYSGLFNDVPDGQWYADPVNMLSDYGIVKGYPDGSFRPDKYVNRAELSSIIKNTIAYMGDPATVCMSEPVTTDIGRQSYPVSNFYRTYWLGSIFTADDCGEQKLKDFFGGPDADFDSGISLTLKHSPWQELVDTFKNIGFSCETASTPELSCKVWRLEKTVKVSDLLKLKGFADVFEMDDCINCG